MLDKVNVADAFSRFDERWTPHVVGAPNDQLVKVAKLEGAYVWHAHEAEDELFLVISGRLRIEVRDGAVTLEPGEFVIVPRGVEHRPVADEGVVHVMLFEPATTRTTGDVDEARTIAPEDLKRL